MSNNKSVVVTLRLSENEIKPLDSAREKLGITRSEFFRMILLNNFDPKVHDKSTKEDLNKALFYFNKTSNNINQIAKSLNTMLLKEEINKEEYFRNVRKLELILDELKRGMNNERNL